MRILFVYRPKDQVPDCTLGGLAQKAPTRNVVLNHELANFVRSVSTESSGVLRLRHFIFTCSSYCAPAAPLEYLAHQRQGLRQLCAGAGAAL